MIIRRLGFNPKGDGGGRPYALPIFLFAQGHKANAVATNTWGAANLRLKNQRSTNHRQIYSKITNKKKNLSRGEKIINK